MTIEEQFKKAQADVLTLTKKPDNFTLLELYGLFKQATKGDATGKRPGRLDIRGRAKFDTWAGHKGSSNEQAMEKYIALVSKLLAG